MKNFKYNEVKLLLEEAEFDYNLIYDAAGNEREKRKLFLRIDKLQTWLRDIENDSN
jgi:hypothetical protein